MDRADAVVGVKDYMKTVGLEAWYGYFAKHLPSNLETIQHVRATTIADLRRMGTEANMRLDAKTTQQVLNALKKEPKAGTHVESQGLDVTHPRMPKPPQGVLTAY